MPYSYRATVLSTLYLSIYQYAEYKYCTEVILLQLQELRGGCYKIYIGATKTALQLGWVELLYYKQSLVRRVYKALNLN